MPSFTLGELGKSLDCQVAGDPSTVIIGVSTVEKAGPGEITFLANMKYASKAKTTRAAAIIAAEPLIGIAAATLVSPNPYHDFARALGLFYQAPKPPSGIHPTAVIDLTLSRMDASFLTGTRFEGKLTALEMQWGRTIGQLPSPCTAGGPHNPGNPLVVPYRWNQGP